MTEENPQKKQYFDHLFCETSISFAQGIFSEWVWECCVCGSKKTASSLKAKPTHCECWTNAKIKTACKFHEPSLRKIERPPIDWYPELKPILENPLPSVLEELKKHFQGEELAAKTIFLISCMAKVKNCQPTSSNLLVNSDSGSGKDFVVKAVLGLWDSNYAIFRSRISPTSLNYWHAARRY